MLFTQETNESQNGLSNKVIHFSGMSENPNNLVIQNYEPISTAPNKVQHICKPISSKILTFFFLYLEFETTIIR